MQHTIGESSLIMIWNVFFMFGGVAAMMIGMKFIGSALEQVAELFLTSKWKTIEKNISSST